MKLNNLFLSGVFILGIVLTVMGTAYLFAVQAQNDDTTVQLQDFSCIADTPEHFKDCLKQTQTNQVPIITISKSYQCHSKDECSFEFNNIKSGVTIRSSETAKIIRVDDFSYPVFSFDSSSGFRLSGVNIQDSGTLPCLPGVVCSPSVLVKKSSNIEFNNLHFSNTHSTSLEIGESKNISVLNSTFDSSFTDGLHIYSAAGSQNLNIKGNTFINNTGNGLLYQSLSPDGEGSFITGNKFMGNHSSGGYGTCAYPCTGSQLKIVGPSSNLNISYNYISGGETTVFDLLGFFVSGIELEGQNTSNFIVSCNEIAGNRGSGIVQTPPINQVGSINISQNKIWGNGLNINVPQAKITSNCYSKSCNVACVPDH